MIVIVTDSTACLNRQEAERLGVTHVPMTYTLDGVTHREHFVEENGDYIARIEGAKTFATSQPPIDATSRPLRSCGRQATRSCACPSPRACREPMPTRSSAPARWAARTSAWWIR